MGVAKKVCKWGVTYCVWVFNIYFKVFALEDVPV